HSWPWRGSTSQQNTEDADETDSHGADPWTSVSSASSVFCSGGSEMRFPLSLTTTMVGYMARKKVSGQKRFPLVLMLEPLHACNLTCTGCGRIREYSQTIKEKLSLQECLRSEERRVGKECRSRWCCGH